MLWTIKECIDTKFLFCLEANISSCGGWPNITSKLVYLAWPCMFKQGNCCFYWNELFPWLDFLRLLHPSFSGLKRSQNWFSIDHGHVDSFTHRNELLCSSWINYRHDVCLWYGLCWDQICLLLVPFGTSAWKTVNSSWNRFKFMGLYSTSPLHHILLVDF